MSQYHGGRRPGTTPRAGSAGWATHRLEETHQEHQDDRCTEEQFGKKGKVALESPDRRRTRVRLNMNALADEIRRIGLATGLMWEVALKSRQVKPT